MLKNSARMAISGMTVALGTVVMMFSFLLPSLSYSLPMVAGGLLIIPLVELGTRSAVYVYVATALLAFILPCDKEAAMMYLLLFGFYPIIRKYFELIRTKALKYIAKYAYFNLAAIGAVLLSSWLFAIPLLEEGEAQWMLWAMLAVGNVAFVLYDYALGKFFVVYLLRFSEKFRKLFDIK